MLIDPYFKGTISSIVVFCVFKTIPKWPPAAALPPLKKLLKPSLF